MIIFSGGEALLRHDLYDLISYAKKQGLNPVIATNGLELTEKNATQLKDSGLSCVAISLHFLDPVAFDDFTGTKNSLDNTLRAIDICNTIGLRFQINTTVFKRNASDIPKYPCSRKTKAQ